MKKYFLAALLATQIIVGAAAQPPTKGKNAPLARPAFTEKSDVKAKALLERMKKMYDIAGTLQADFSLLVELGNKKQNEEKGKIYLKGEKYRVEMSDQNYISDATTRWVHLKNNKEVQIGDAKEDNEDALTPADLMKIYESPHLIYAIVGEGVESGKAVTLIEFKPLKGHYDEYSKFRAAIDKTTAQLVSLKVFGKDAMVYTFKFTNTLSNSKIADTLFSFDKTKFPGVQVVDLR
jgi:outer membrane lipoprotein-sorting protein